MMLSAHQPAYLPWAGLLDKVRQADVFVILDTVQRSHGDWSNRNRIKTQNGPLMLTVPLLGPRQELFRNVRIDGSKKWRRKHFRAMELAYGKAPFWSLYRDTLTSILAENWRRLVDLNEYLLRWLILELEVRTTVVRASSLIGVDGAKNDLLIALCKAAGANKYLFGALGRDYADLEAFEKAGVEPLFQQYEPKPYDQLHGAFVPGLSMLDMLLCVGPEQARALL